MLYDLRILIIYYSYNLVDLNFLFCLVAEILYALQWCEELEHRPVIVSEYHKLLRDWDVVQKVHTDGLDKVGVLETPIAR